MAEIVIVNCEAYSFPPPEAEEALRTEALAHFESGDPEREELARNLMAERRRLRARREELGPTEERRELTAEEEAQRLEDAQEGRRARRRAFRAERDGRLAASDWSQLADAPLTDPKRAEWATYRQALRDLTFDADEIDWPDEPA